MTVTIIHVDDAAKETTLPVSAWTDRVDRDAIVSLASELISIPSPSGEERDVMEFVAGWCAGRGLGHRVIAKDHLRPNVIVSIGGRRVRDSSGVADAIENRRPGRRVRIEYRRGSTSRSAVVKLGVRPTP